MDLWRALRLSEAPRVAFTGGGGKTTALFRLARQLTPPVWVTTSTHLGQDQVMHADEHLVVASQGIEQQLEEMSNDGISLITGEPTEDERVLGVDPDRLERLAAIAHQQRIPLLVEADGSRGYPLKAPASHEPAIPAWVEHVVVVAGMSGINLPLGEPPVHRAERFGELSGLKPGEPVTPAALARVLTHTEGGLKNIPRGARRTVLLNQADTPELRESAALLAKLLLPTFDAVLVASLGMAGAPVYAVYERSAGVVLAAGASERLGRPKQLLEWRGVPFVRAIASTALEAGLDPVIVVTGAYREQVEAALEGLPIQTVHNPNYEAGQSSSIKTGLRALPPETGSAVFLLSDQPQVSTRLLQSLVEAHARDLSPLVAPQVGHRRANPVLFDRVTFPDLFEIGGDVGGRALFSLYPLTYLPWEDVSLLLDVDTEADYQALKKLENDPKRGS